MRNIRKKRYYAFVIILVLIIGFLNADRIGRLIYPLHYQEEIISSSKQYDVNPYWIAAIIRVESNFRSDRVSHKGATGMMQIMPETARWIAEQGSEFSESSPDLLTVPTLNIRMGTWYIRYLEDFFAPYFERMGMDEDRDRLATIAASYNAGQGAVQNWLQSGIWDGRLTTSDRIPYQETRNYVQRVNYYYKKYSNLYNDLIGYESDESREQ
ncbi:transglycosylase [Insulibacter thermoxylanivorax]|uniref:Transglycosylase n=1 Tax=Insulibacter thermoxylanivorax TaxID=2749268 RepID=A0A916VFN2_9BACL|nr:lytic transglycosylase domain-containing protein [Insulibacter thermoxylanivorax]GFR38063.1 transglycosylase [Insulibacter thermoxylanivorax]